MWLGERYRGQRSNPLCKTGGDAEVRAEGGIDERAGKLFVIHVIVGKGRGRLPRAGGKQGLLLLVRGSKRIGRTRSHLWSLAEEAPGRRRVSTINRSSRGRREVYSGFAGGGRALRLIGI